MPDDSTPPTMRRTFLKGTGAAAAGLSLGVSHVQARDPETAEPERELIVELSETATFDERASELAAEHGLKRVMELERINRVVYRQPDRTLSVEQFADRLTRSADVLDARRNFELEPLAFDDPRLEDQYAPQQVNALEAWEQAGLGDEDVSVCIIDSGVDYDHENLRSRFGDNPGPDDPDDAGFHGTHVAGIAGGSIDNGTGTAGMANVRLYAVAALQGGGGLAAVADGILWAADQGVDLVNLSLGDPYGRETPEIRDAAAEAYEQSGTLTIAAAGNEGSTDSVLYPAGHDICMAVSAVGESENIARFSSRGPEIEITGPGADVLSCQPNDRYQRLSGTSMSSPAVVGVAALGKSANNDLSPGELRAALKETATDIGLSDTEQGKGRVDAAALVERVGDGSPEPGTPEAVIDASTTNPEVGETVELDGTGSSSPNGPITDFAWDYEPGGSDTGPTATLQRDEPGTVTVELTVTDGENRTDTATETIEFEEGDADPEPEPEAPEAVIEASSTTPDVGERITLDGTGSSSPNGDIVEYAWNAEPGGSTTGATTSLQRTRAVAVDVTLTVTDEEDRTDNATETIEFGAPDPEPEPEAPEAVIEVSSTTPDVGERVSLDGTGSSSPNGEIVEYAWNAQPGGSTTGATASLRRRRPTTVDVTLTVTDEEDQTDSATETIEFTGRRATGGVASRTHTIEGTVGPAASNQVYTYPSELDSPENVDVSLKGPSNADFDLFVTLDGRTPTPEDFDRRSVGAGASKRLVVENPEPGQILGIRVEGASGFGAYEVTVEEYGI